MSRSLGSTLPDALLGRLLATGGDDPSGPVVVLLAVDPYGWPHPALVSYAELLALDARRVRLALHQGTRTSRHVSESGRVTLVFSEPGLALYVKADASPLPRLAEAPDLARFELHVRDVLEDRAEGEEAGARLASGITVAWPEEAAIARRRARLRDALRA